MAITYKLIASTTVGSGGIGEIEFSNIPQTYTDLVVKFCCRNDGQVWGRVSFNSSGTIDQQSIYRNNTVSGSNNDNSYTIWSSWPSSNANAFSYHEMYIPNYTNTNFSKIVNQISTQTNNSADTLWGAIFSLRWTNSSAINNIKLTSHNAPSNKWVQNTTAYLYGIKRD